MAAESISTEELRAMLVASQPVTVVDIREPAERDWSIPGSLMVDAHDAVNSGILGPLADLDFAGGPVVTVCGAGKTAALATRLLRAKGVEAVTLEGGMRAWSLAWNTAETNLSGCGVIQVRRTGKGCLSYIVEADGEAVVIDASVDPVVYLKELRDRGWRLVAIVDTHIHADHLSRSRSLAQLTGADLWMPANERTAFAFRPVADGDRIPFGSMALQALHTPGHTAESATYLLDEAVAFTGDTLFVGGVGRPDLEGGSLGESALRAGQLHHSLGRLLQLSAAAVVLPGHASDPIAFDGRLLATTVETIRDTLALTQMGREEFIEAVLARIPATPPNHSRIVELNERGEVPEDAGELEAGANRSRSSEASRVTAPRAVMLGLRANWRQFAILVAVNAFVGGMVGVERSTLAPLAGHDFHVASRAAIFSFLISFGLVKAGGNFIAGRLADRLGRRGVLLLGWSAALPVPLLIIFAPSWGWVVFANVLLGLNQGLAWSTTVNMKIDLVGPRHRGFALGLNEASGYLAVSVVAAVAGFLAASYGIRPWPYLLAEGLAICGLLLSLLTRETTGHVELESAGALPSPSVTKLFLDVTFRDRTMSSACLAGMVNNLNDGMAWALLPLFFAAHGLGLREIGVLAGAYPAVWGAGQLGTGWLSDGLGRKGLIVTGMLLQALAIAGFGLLPGFGWWLVESLLLGAGTALVYPTLLAVIGDSARTPDRATSVGIYRLWRDSGYAVGAIVTGVIADAAGFPAAIIIVAMLTAVSGTVVALRMRETMMVRAGRIELSER